VADIFAHEKHANESLNFQDLPCWLPWTWHLYKLISAPDFMLYATALLQTNHFINRRGFKVTTTEPLHKAPLLHWAWDRWRWVSGGGETENL